MHIRLPHAGWLLHTKHGGGCGTIRFAQPDEVQHTFSWLFTRKQYATKYRWKNERQPTNSMETTTQSADEQEAKQPMASEAKIPHHVCDPSPSPYLEGWRLYALATGLMLSCICSGLVRKEREA
jgi:hypothetical protein